jgi:hypothetical protein
LAAFTGSHIIVDIGVHLGPEKVASNEFNGFILPHMAGDLGVVFGFADFSSKIVVVWNPETSFVV